MTHPLKLFPNLCVARDPGKLSPGVHVRRSAILQHMGPLKQLGRREYVDPAFLEEVAVTRTNRIEGRWIASPVHDHQVVRDEETLLALTTLMEERPELFGTATLTTALELRETSTPVHLMTTSDTMVLGSGQLRFGDRLHELSMAHPLHLPAHCCFETQADTFIILFSATPVDQGQLPLSPCPEADLEIPTETEEGPLHFLLTPQKVHTPAAAIVHFQVSGVTEVWYLDMPVDVIYPGEERIFPCDASPWELRPCSPETPVFFQF